MEGGKGGGERAGEVDSVGLCGVSGERTLQETSESNLACGPVAVCLLHLRALYV